MPATTTATDLQRNFKRLKNKIKKGKEPVTVLSNNKPELVVMDYDTFKEEYRRKKKLKKTKKSDFSEFLGVWTEEEADEFDAIIEDAFEQINPEDWK